MAGMMGRAAIVAGAHGGFYLHYLLIAVELWGAGVALILGLACRNQETWGRTKWGALLLAVGVGIATCVPIWPPVNTGVIDVLVSVVLTMIIQIPALALGLGVGWVWRRCWRLCSRRREHAASEHATE